MCLDVVFKTKSLPKMVTCYKSVDEAGFDADTQRIKVDTSTLKPFRSKFECHREKKTFKIFTDKGCAIVERNGDYPDANNRYCALCLRNDGRGHAGQTEKQTYRLPTKFSCSGWWIPLSLVNGHLKTAIKPRESRKQVAYETSGMGFICKIGHTYTDTASAELICDTSFGRYPTGFHAWAFKKKAVADTGEHVLKIELSDIVAKGKQNGSIVYVGRKMKVISLEE